MNNNEIILFETEDRMISLPVMVKNETVWLNRNQLSELFERDIKTIGKHINNALSGAVPFLYSYLRTVFSKFKLKTFFDEISNSFYIQLSY